jgi:hypothetical protein
MAAAQSKDKRNVTQSATQSLRLENLLENVKKVRLIYQFRDSGADEKQSSLRFSAASTSSQSPSLALMSQVSYCTISDNILISPQWRYHMMPS